MTEGQSLAEFMLIIAVVILCSIMGLTLLGDNVNAVFASSSNKVSKFDPFNVKGHFSDAKKSNNRPNNNYTENTKPYISDSSVIGNYSVDELSDGSVTFYVKDKEITENNYFEGVVIAENDPLLNGAKINGNLTLN